MNQYIGLTGLAGAGKTTAAIWLHAQMGYCVRPVADALKSMAAEVLAPDQLNGQLKEIPDARLCGLTPRQFMQRLGTEFGRNLVGEDFWINQWLAKIATYAPHARIVADDVRFKNEAAAIRRLGGIIIEIRRPGAGSSSGANHVSEAMPITPDWIIEAHDIASLHRQLAGLWD